MKTKISKKMIVIGLALVGLVSGFVVEHQCMQNMPKRSKEPLLKKSENLDVCNHSGTQVKAAFYSKYNKRRGSVINLKSGKTSFKRKMKAPIFAVARKKQTLTKSIDNSVAQIKTSRLKKIGVENHGYELVLTPPHHCKNH